MKRETRLQLMDCAARFETTDFMKTDPSQFMHQVSGVENQELMAFIATCLSYGSRQQFLPKIAFLLQLSEGNVAQWIREKCYKTTIVDTPARFYRLQTYHHVHQLLNALHQLLIDEGSLRAFVKARANTAIDAIAAISAYFSLWDVGHLVPRNTTSSCKRMCMFLRWMVRGDSPVDLGLWTFIDKRTLIIPLDTHVMQEALRLKLITGKQANMRTAQKITAELLKVFPQDPMKGDFALFGYGTMEEANAQKE